MADKNESDSDEEEFQAYFGKDDEPDDKSADESDVESDAEIVPEVVADDATDDDGSEVGDVVADDDDLLDDDIEVLGNAIHVYKFVPSDERRTPNFIGKYELNNLLSARADLISKHNDCYVDCNELDDPYKMALAEYNQKKCPLKLHRVVGERYDKTTNTFITFIEQWDVNEINSG